MTLGASVSVFITLTALQASDFDAARLRTGVFRYRTTFRGKPAGDSLIQISKQPNGHYVFSNQVSGEFKQSWEAVSLPDFTPISARLDFDVRPGFELHYNNGRVTGFVTRTQRKVDDSILPGTVDQRIDWAAVMSLERPSKAFHVYDPGTGNSRVTVTIGNAELTTGAYKTVEVTYHILKNNGTEEYRIRMTKDLPRMMVREDFPNGAVTELINFNP
jgi:hypothetical protein